MTRTLHASDSEESSSSPPKLSSRYRRDELNASEAGPSSDDTVTLYDPAIILPYRSVERRRNFQKLLQRYNTQLLYGCSNPECSTRTCLSYQKRKSKGPFRPYTVLSARTLATFLASQDHPERGLCPHAHKSHSNHSAERTAQRRAESPVYQSHKSSSQNTAPKNAGGEINSGPAEEESRQGVRPTAGLTSRWPSLQKIHESIWGTPSKSESSGEPEPAVETQPPKLKDPKSFAQNLFDTVVMRSLHTGLPLAESQSSAGAVETEDFSKSPEVPTEMSDSPYQSQVERMDHSNGVPREETVKVEPDHIRPSLKKRQKSDILCRLDGLKLSSDTKPTPEFGLEGPKAANINALHCPSSPDIIALSKDPDASIFDDAGGSEEQKERRHGSTKRKSARQKKAPMVDEAVASGMKPLQPSQEQISTGDDHVHPPKTAKSLRYFSYEMIQSFIAEHKLDVGDLPTYEAGLHVFDRLKSRLSSFEKGEVHQWDQSDPKNFLCQSVVYVCSTPAALLSSFLQCRQEGDLLIGNSAGLRKMTSAINLLRGAMIDRATIFSSLWTSLDSVFPAKPDRTSSSHQKATSPNPLSSSSDAKLEDLNDTEAAHIIKITFAALNEDMPWLTRQELEGLQQARASGFTTSYGASQRVCQRPIQLSAIQEAIDCLEDDIAVSLITRLCKAIGARKYAGRTGRQRPAQFLNNRDLDCSCSDFVTLVCRNLLDDKSMEQQLQDGLSTPSLRGGRLRAHWKQNVIKVTSKDNGIALVVEWLRTVILKNWDCQSAVPKAGAVDGALQMLASLHKLCSRDDLPASVFCTPFLDQRLDYVDMPVQWANAQTDSTKLHLLSYPFMFAPSARITYFRAINHHTMNRSYERAVVNAQLLNRLTYTDTLRKRGEIRARERLQSCSSKYLVLEIRRDHVLTDAMNYLWRCRPSELMKPLKVRMGMNEGEMGVDHGGVQQEFFRIALAEALDPKYGAFTTDSQTRMSWFQPFSLEPLYKFELIGLLVGLAVYNGLTLPVTFPLALYVQLAGNSFGSVEIEMIEDGWPDLARGLKAMRDWDDGDVADVFVRTYTFSLDVFGTTVDVDMDAERRRRSRRQQKSREALSIAENDDEPGEGSDSESTPPPLPLSSSSSSSSTGEIGPFVRASLSRGTIIAKEDRALGDSDSRPLNYRSDSPTPSTPMVTNANRNQYIADYIEYLTYLSVAPQFSAFNCGFQRCLNRKSLSLFDTPTLKTLIEGHQQIDTHALQRITTYEGGFSARHHLIQSFWHIVHSWGLQEEYGQSKIRGLLEFVTASDRLPVGGVERVTFVIQKNGRGNESLPTSLTCFGRLLLPDYSSHDILQKNIERAIEEAKGFGVP